MCPAESKVILNYDNVEGLDKRYENAIVQSYNPGGSHAKYYMADTVYMLHRKGVARESMCKMAKDAAPLATKLIIEGSEEGRSHDIPYRNPRMYAFA